MLKKILPIAIALAAIFGTGSVSEVYAKSSVTHSKTTVQKETAYITHLKMVHDKLFGSFDYIQWYEGKAADREFVKDCKCKDMPYAPDGYYIRNVNPKIRTFPIAKSAIYVLQTRTGEINWNEKVTKAQFIDFVKKHQEQQGYYIPYHIELNKGIITKITEQYIP